MDIEQLKYFLAVCDCKQMTQAADKLFISQPALSKHIGQLEKELGISLFDRCGRSLHITSAGMDFEDYAREAVARHEDIMRRLRHRLNTAKATLTVGTIPILSQYNLHKIILAFCKDNPDIALNLLEEKGDYALKLLEDELVELAILRTETLPHDGYKTIDLAHDRLVLVCSPQHPLAHAEEVDLCDLGEEYFFLLDVGHFPRYAVIQACQRAGFSPRIKQAFTRIETIIGFVAENAGIALLMEKDLTAFATHNICLKKLASPVSSTVALVFPHGRQLSPAACLFKDYIRAQKGNLWTA